MAVLLPSCRGGTARAGYPTRPHVARAGVLRLSAPRRRPLGSPTIWLSTSARVPPCMRIVVVPGRVGAPMAEPGEAGHVPDLAIAGVVVVRIELAFIEELDARRAAIVVLAAAMHRHDLADEGRGRVKTAPAPLSAHRAALEAAWPSFRPGPGQTADLIGRRLAPALGGVAEDVPALTAMRLNERVEAALARLELHGVRPQSGEFQKSGDEGAAARRGLRQLVAAVGADEPRAVRAGDEAGLEPVGAPLRSGQEDQLELARLRGHERDVMHRRDHARHEVREALEDGQARAEPARFGGIWISQDSASAS